MTKADLVNTIAEKALLQHKQAEVVVNMVFDMMVDALKRDDRIEIRGFGSFVNRSYGSYQGRNPKTGQVVQVPPKRVPFFKVGKELKEMVDYPEGRPKSGVAGQNS
jgi:integration host factor subunit beta